MRRLSLVLATVALMHTAAFQGRAQEPVPTVFTYQGQLKHDGQPVNGMVDLKLTLWDAQSGGTQIGPQNGYTGGIEHGLFALELDFGEDCWAGEARWLEVAVEFPAGVGSHVTLPSRQLITPAPYAMALPAFRTLPNATSPNALGGWEGNSLTDGVVGALVAGGGSPLISGNPRPNRATDNYCTVSGGAGNQAGDGDATVDDANNATVGGGYANSASGPNSTVAGGWYNRATGSRSTAAGGWNNLASADAATVSGGRDSKAEAGHAVVSGGYGNNATSLGASVGGGRGNTASGDYATVGGGKENTAGSLYNAIAGGWGNSTSHGRTTIGGGVDNTAAGDSATIAGGQNNTTGGVAAAIPGGSYNSAMGYYSMAAGRRAKALHDGAFVWADSTDADFQSTGVNQFLIRAGGGVGIGVADPTEQLTVDGTVYSMSGGFKFPDGTVQTTAGSGLGLTLPYSGSCPCDDPRLIVPAFDVINAMYGVAVRGTHEPTANAGYLGGSLYGVHGESTAGISSPPPVVGAGVLGVNTGGGNGVRGESDAGIGVRGEGATGISGVGDVSGVYGYSTNGHAGYFVGKSYLSGQVGIGTEDPTNLLDVRGAGTDMGGADTYDEVVARFRNTGAGHSAASIDAAGGQDAILYFAEAGEAHWDIRHDADNADSLNIRYQGGIEDNWSVARFLSDGTTRVRVLEIVGGADLAEPFAVANSKDGSGKIEPGMVVVIDPDHPGQLKLASDPYDLKVAGVISGAKGLKPGMVMKAEGTSLANGEHPVALTGRVWCWCDATEASIRPGDLLTTSATPGHAMKVTDHSRASGAIIGKAMTPLSGNTGLVLVLVSLQ